MDTHSGAEGAGSRLEGIGKDARVTNLVKLGDISEVLNGYAFKSKEYVSHGVRVIRITNVQKGDITDENPKYYEEQDALERYRILADDILISLTGNVGRVGMFPSELLPAYLNQRVGIIRINEEKVCRRFLFHYLNGSSFEQIAIANSSGVAQLNLSSKWLSNHEIPLPPLAEQQRIAAILDAADAHRRHTKALLEKYDQLAQSIFLEMFGDPVTNPMGWERRKVSSIVSIKSSKRIFKDEYVQDGVPFYRTKEIVELSNRKTPTIELFISKERFEEIERKFSYPQRGDILLSAVGTIGKMWIVNRDDPFYFKDGNLIWLQASDSSKIRPLVLKRILEGIIEFSKAREAKGAAYNAITIAGLKQLEIPLPSAHRQEMYVSRLAHLDKQYEFLNEENTISGELFSSLLQRAFKGEL